MAGWGVGRKNRRLCSLKDCVCKSCGASFKAVHSRAGFCSRTCAGRFYHSKRAYRFDCIECGIEFFSKQSRAKCCSAGCIKEHLRKSGLRQAAEDTRPRKWANRADAYRYYAFKRRAVIGAADAEPIVASVVFERDGWLCQICGEEIDRDLVYPNPGAATVDHRIPISLGGRHIYENVQCAHLGCNSRKSNKLACEAA